MQGNFWRWDRKRDGIFLLALLLLSLGANVVLAIRVRTVSARNYQPEPIIGRRVTLGTVATLDGKRRELALSHQKPTLMYVFKPSCPWCQRNERAISALASAKASEYDIAAISLASSAETRAFVRTASIAFPVYAEPSGAIVRDLDLGTTPQTIVIDRNGIVVKSWLGAYVGGVSSEVQSYFQLPLPPVTSSERSQ